MIKQSDSPTRERRVRVGFRDQYNTRQRFYVTSKEAAVLDETNAATYKPGSTREMNLLHGLAISRSAGGQIVIDEIRFVPTNQFIPKLIPQIYEKCLRLKLNCKSWARFSSRPSTEPYELRGPITLHI